MKHHLRWSSYVFIADFWKKGAQQIYLVVALEISRTFCYLCIDASLGLLLCTLLVVEQIRRETRPRGMLSCVSFMESGSENSADQFVKKIACGKPTTFKIVGDIGQAWQLRKAITIAVSISVSPVSNNFSFCRNATERHIQGVLVLSYVRVLFCTNSNWFTPKMRYDSSKLVDWQHQWRHACLCPWMENRQGTPNTTHTGSKWSIDSQNSIVNRIIEIFLSYGWRS